MTMALATLWAALLALVLAGTPSHAEAGRGGVALAIELEGPIGPAAARYVKEALATAARRQATVVILRMNTPGGLSTSMREIIADVIASQVPVIGYVAPSGAHAASAGTYILYATHVAAMAPGTNIGAATPVAIGGLPGSSDDKKTEQPHDTLAEKATNDAVALIRSLAEMRGRNADWAEKAVREAATLSATGALKEKVIDIVAPDTVALLDQADGRTVTMADGATLRLETRGLRVETIEPGWLIKALGVITDPNIAFLLMLVGIYGLIVEFTSPGAVAPGVVGTICLLLGLYGLNMLPISYTGLALILIGIACLVIEVFNPTAVLGIGGLGAFILGSAMLLRVQEPAYQLSWSVIAAAAAMLFALIVVVGGSLWRVRRTAGRLALQSMRGLTARVLDWSGGEGHVFARGERWQARSTDAFLPGDTVEVTDMKDLTLLVRRRAARAVNRGGPV